VGVAESQVDVMVEGMGAKLLEMMVIQMMVLEQGVCWQWV
jgi:hypothetical protein